MSTLALNINMHGKQVVLVGGGRVALRKLRTLLATGASVMVVSPQTTPEMSALVRSGALTVKDGCYHEADVDNAFLVIAATDDAEVNEQVRVDARQRGILVAVADNPTAGDCTFPALLRRGDLEVAVSTGGRCPTFAADVRDHIAGLISCEYGAILDQLAAEREKLLTNGNPSTYNTQVLRSLAHHLLAELTELKGPVP